MRRMFSEKQIKSIIQESINNNEFSFDAHNLNIVSEEWKAYASGVETSDITIENIYTNISMVAGVLYLVANIKITNTSESGISYPYIDKVIEVEKDIADKIFDLSGKKVSETPTYGTGITAEVGVKASSPDLIGISNYSFQVINSTQANKFSIRFREIPSISAGASLYLMGRIALTI